MLQVLRCDVSLQCGGTQFSSATVGDETGTAGGLSLNPSFGRSPLNQWQAILRVSAQQVRFSGLV